jgi:hypothetical protein
VSAGVTFANSVISPSWWYLEPVAQSGTSFLPKEAPSMSFYTDCHRSYLVRGIAQSLANLAVLTILAALLQTAGWPQELGSLPIDRAIPAALNHPKGTEDVTHSPCKVRFHKGKPTANVNFCHHSNTFPADTNPPPLPSGTSIVIDIPISLSGTIAHLLMLASTLRLSGYY